MCHMGTAMDDGASARGVLDLCLLAVISEGPAYGYEMTKRLRARGLSIVGEGSIYPLLGRLERDALVKRACGSNGARRASTTASLRRENARSRSVCGSGRRRATPSTVLSVWSRWRCSRARVRRGVSCGMAAPRRPGSDRQRDGADLTADIETRRPRAAPPKTCLATASSTPAICRILGRSVRCHQPRGAPDLRRGAGQSWRSRPLRSSHS